ncbi:MAG: hypothetical protein QNK37_03430 [Acidobacteriota bacterium]|nr:hypothetical protein [Acidobacteriota bacterium]
MTYHATLKVNCDRCDDAEIIDTGIDLSEIDQYTDRLPGEWEEEDGAHLCPDCTQGAPTTHIPQSPERLQGLYGLNPPSVDKGPTMIDLHCEGTQSVTIYTMGRERYTVEYGDVHHHACEFFTHQEVKAGHLEMAFRAAQAIALQKEAIWITAAGHVADDFKPKDWAFEISVIPENRRHVIRRDGGCLKCGQIP